MSTKIYEAYQTDSMAYFDSFVKFYRKEVFKNTIKTINELKKDFKIEEIKKSFLKSEILTENELERMSDEWLKCFFVLYEMMDMSKKQLNDIFNFDCSFNFWYDSDGKIYFIPYNSRICQITIQMKRKFRLKDFSYFNNTDLPEGVTRKKWNLRKNKWDELCLKDFNDWHKNRYSHIIIEAKNPFNIGLIDVENGIFKHQKEKMYSPLLYANIKYDGNRDLDLLGEDNNAL